MVESQLQQIESRLRTVRTEYDLHKRQVETHRSQLNEQRERLCWAEEAQQILQVLVQTVQEKAHAQIASVVSRCLEAVFDEPYEFKIHFERKRGHTEARLTFVRGGLEISPMDAAGGGVVDVAAFALRLACLMLARPKVRKLLVLDEPFRFVSAGHRAAIRELLTTLAEETGVQFIMVTHIESLRIGKVVELSG